MGQKLSPTAKRAKAARDKAYAMSEWGKYKKRTAQVKDCPDGHLLVLAEPIDVGGLHECSYFMHVRSGVPFGELNLYFSCLMW